MTASSARRMHLLLAWSWLAVLVITTGLLAWHSLSDRDVWLHARAGRDILAGDGFTGTNTYSFTFPDEPWVNHEWAFQVLVAALGPPEGNPDAVAGWHGLRTVLALALVGVLLLGDGGRDRLRGTTGAGALLGVGLGLLLGLGLLWTRLILRPELISFVCLVLMVRTVERALGPDSLASAPGWRTWLDPRCPGGQALVITLAWVQFHGFAAAAPVLWVLGTVGALLAPWLRSETATTSPRPSAGRILAVGLGGAVLALAALGISPNGSAGWTYPLRALGQFGADGPNLSSMIAELVPLLETTNALGFTLILFRLSLVWGALWIVAQWGRIPLLRVLVWLAAVGVALAGQRGLGPYAVALMLLHTAPVTGPRTPWSRWWPGPARRLPAAVASVMLFAVVVGLLWPRLVNDDFYLREGVARRFGGGLTPSHAPGNAALWLRGHGAGRVAANVDAAGCLLAVTRARLWIDGRTEAYPPRAWQGYDILRRGGAPALELLQRTGPDAICLTVGSVFGPLIDDLAASPSWRLAHAGQAAVVFISATDPSAGTAPDARAAGLLRRAERDDLGTARRADFYLAASRFLGLAGDEDGALAALRRGAAVRPDHAILRHNLGTALLGRREAAAAREEFQAALAANPRLAEAAVNAGVCAVTLGDTEAAERAFRRAVAINPRLFQAWANLGGLLARRGDSAEALEAVSRALELRPDDPRLRAARDRLRSEVRRR
ncbi:MAG: tetratricopeptide repeat protein [bacterium]|nr:tetratricopeptide repeat protein [bacterium]